MLQNLKAEKITFKDYFKMSKEVFVNNFRNILFIGLVVYLPFIILNSLVIGRLFDEIIPFYNYIQTEDMLDLQVIDTFMVNAMKYILIILLLDTVFKSIAKGGMVYITNAYVHEEKVTKDSIIKNSINKTVSLFFTRLMYIFIISITLPTVILPIYFGISMLFYCEENVLQNKKPFKALSGSKSLIRSKKGRFYNVFIFYSAFYMLNIVCSMILSWVFASFQIYGIVGAVIGNLMLLVFLLFFSIPVTLKYIRIACDVIE